MSLDRILTDEERAIRNVARNFAKDRLMPRVVQAFRNESVQIFKIYIIYLSRQSLFFATEFDRSVINEMGELGLLGATIHGYGCPGASPSAYGLIAHEVEKYFFSCLFLLFI